MKLRILATAVLLVLVAGAALAAHVATGWPGGGNTSHRASMPTTVAVAATPASPPLDSSADAVLLAAGDIAKCGSSGDQATAAILAATQGAITTLGDDAYEQGPEEDFARCYAPAWGRFLDRTHPAPGNHEYLTSGAAGYFGYFGASAGPPGAGYYSFNLGAWHIIALNSNCNEIGGCGPGSPEERWLRADLAANPAQCTLAYWHHPRFSSGEHGDDTRTQELWQALYDGGAEIVLNGHDHDYERFAPQDPTGHADPARGIREFVAGTGGANHYEFGSVQPNSEVRNGDTFGILQLRLHPDGYDWQFLPEADKSFTDHGSGACH